MATGTPRSGEDQTSTGHPATGEWLGAGLLVRAAGEGRPAAADALAQLTERELEVLRMVAQGATNREIGEALVISQVTVRADLHSIFGKLGLDSLIQAAAYAVRMGFASPPTEPSRAGGARVGDV